MLLLLACTAPCPPEMALVREQGQAWCLDRWEGRVEVGGVAVTQLQQPLPRGAMVRSVAGVLPTTGLQYEEALQACANTQIGTTQKHLATAAEWLGGAVGMPGSHRNWGPADDRLAGACNTQGPGPKRLLETGSLPGCCTASGVCDQVGNAFEWVDSERRIDSAQALAELAAAGIDLRVLPSGWLHTDHCDQLRQLSPQAITIRGHSLSCDTNGFLYAVWEGGKADPVGYLLLEEGPQRPRDVVLPVRFLTHGAEAQLQLNPSLDGRPLPEKIGGSWYIPLSPASLHGSHAHAPDFRGTIGVRCASRL